MNEEKIYNRLLDSNFPIYEAIRRAERGYELTNVDEFLNDLFEDGNNNVDEFLNDLFEEGE